MASDRIANHESRISNLESDMSDVKVDLASISVKLDASEVRAADRFAALSTSSLEVKEILQQREKEVRKYRERREELELKAQLDHKNWIRSLINPQTIFIVIAILLSMLGLRVNDIQTMATVIGTPLPKPPVEVIVEDN
jgi:hypothetical protein